jgi:hypothetical protein
MWQALAGSLIKINDLLHLALTERTRRSTGNLWVRKEVGFKQSASGAYIAIDRPREDDRSQR